MDSNLDEGDIKDGCRGGGLDVCKRKVSRSAWDGKFKHGEIGKDVSTLAKIQQWR